MAAPTHKDDGFRDERCGYCGEKIGYGFFVATEYVQHDGSIVVGFRHKDRVTRETPYWCTPKGAK